MDADSAMRPGKPQTVKELVRHAENFSFNANIPLKHWTRAADTLYQEANFALSDGDYGRAYMMLYRHSVLVLNSLPKHPQYKERESRKMCKALEKRVDQILVDLERLKPAIEAAYREWERMQPENEPPPPPPTDRPHSYADFAARDPTLTGNARILDASENQDLAVDLAQKELTRRDTVRRATRQAGVSDEETMRRRRAGTWDNWDRSTMIGSDLDLQKQMEAARWNLDNPSAMRESDQNLAIRDSSAQQSASHYSYPSINKSQPVAYDRSQSHTSLPPPMQPQRPPKERMQSASGAVPRPSDPAPPSIPQKVTLNETYQPLEPESPWRPASPVPALPPKQMPDVPVPTLAPPPPKKERLTFKPGAYLENGDPIRSVFLPRSLRRSFLELASNNTKKGLEMCGILCGTPVNNALFIRCLVIPDQKCTPDTCETENESAVFDFCESEDLMMIGWIHTHPTQSCFMSSRDLHTHAGYQIMMPESVAIVCAPKFEPSYGIFRLTNPPGLEHILSCTHADTFHQHHIDNLYREAEQPHGHVYESDKLPYTVQDLRTK